jgi:hypothetical protein
MATISVELFTSQNDFTEFLDVGSTPELETLKQQLQAKIAAFPKNVRSALKDLCETRLRLVREELSVR